MNSRNQIDPKLFAFSGILSDSTFDLIPRIAGTDSGRNDFLPHSHARWHSLEIASSWF